MRSSLKLIPTLLMAGGLAACGDTRVQTDRLDTAAPQAVYAEADMLAPSARKQPSAPQSEPSEPSGLFLAYRYGYGLELPSASVKPTVDKHMQMCADAGPARCQIMGSQANEYSEDNVSANLSLRAAPAWLDTFTAALRADVDEADGKITRATTTVDDLTRAILDTDARLSAQRSLRTRLEGLLETRDAKLPDLLALERELARVQGEIESATANLKALRARVSMSTVDIAYASQSVAVSRGAFSPVGRALKDFVGIVADGLSGVIRFIAVILPWLIFVIIPGLFALRWFWRRRKVKV